MGLCAKKTNKQHLKKKKIWISSFAVIWDGVEWGICLGISSSLLPRFVVVDSLCLF